MAYPLHFDHTGRTGDRWLRWLWWLAPLGLLVLMAAGGCDSMARLRDPDGCYVRPSVAVIDFDANQSPFGWRVGDGLADILTDELIKTGRFHVLERPNVDTVLAELRFQQGEATRPQGRQPVGRLKNVEYLIRGKVTDFGHVSGAGFWAAVDRLNLFGARHKAVIRLTFYVVEVASGEIVASRTVQSAVRAQEGSAEAVYKNVAMGGSMFYKTPLGQATAEATRAALTEIVETIASRPWQPRIALIREGEVVVNGGQDRRIQAGQFYRAIEPGDVVVDPETGNVLGQLPGRTVGQIEITRVEPNYSVGRVMTRANFTVGQHLQSVESRVVEAKTK